MTANVKEIVSTRLVPATAEKVSVTDGATRISAAVVTNVTASTDATVTVWLGTSATAAQAVIFQQRVRPGEAYTCPELVGQVLEGLNEIHIAASNASTLTVRVSGVEYT